MKVGLVCPYDLSKPGGVQAQVLDLAKILADLGDEVSVIGPALPPDVEGVDLGKSVSIPGNGSVVPISLDTRTRSKIREVDVDVLHVHEPLMPVTSLAALRADHPVVATFHAAPQGFGSLFYKLLSGRLTRVLGPNVSVVTAVSASAAQPLGEIEYEIVPNGLDVGAFRGDGLKKPGRVAFLGRDETRKGLDVLVEAWPVVIAAHPEAELVVMGATRDVAGIKWMGRVDDQTKTEVLNTSEIFVAPNTGGESFGIVLVEAMASGAAVVASDLRAFQDVGGDAASYFSNGSSSHLARVLIELLSSPERVSRLQRAGEERVVDFDWSIVASRYRELYDMAVS